MKHYTDLFIDFDDTLYDTRANSQKALEELFEEFGLGSRFARPQTFYDAYWQHNVELWAQYAHGEIAREHLIVERFRRPLSLGRREGEPWPTAAYCLAMSDRFLELCSNKTGVVEGAHELMAYLRRKGYRTHICSNGFHEVQYKKLRASALLDQFDTIVLSEDAGANKPSRQFFDYAMSLTGASAPATLMIGDNYHTDIIGAMGAGIDTLYFAPHADSRPDLTALPHRPTFTVGSLREIMEVL